MASELGVQTIQHTNGTDALVVGSDGVVTAAQYIKQSGVPAFSVYLTTTHTDSASVVVFTGVEFNQGNHYSTSTGQFTAPVDGVYHFGFTFLSENNSGQASVQLRKNGVNYAECRNTSQADHESTSVYATVKLTAGDTVDVYYRAGTALMLGSDRWSTFGGHLVG